MESLIFCSEISKNYEIVPFRNKLKKNDTRQKDNQYQ